MVTTIDPQNVRDSLDALADTYDIPQHEIDSIKYDIDKIVDEYDDRVECLEGECSTLENEKQDLEGELDEKRGYGSVEEFASAMLSAFAGQEPNMGEVLSLKDDLEKLLTTKYNISMGNL